MDLNDLNKKFLTSANQLQAIIGTNSDAITCNADLVKLGNTSWQSICNRRNAQTMASLDIKLYYKNKSNKKTILGKKITKDQKKHLRTTKKELNEVEEIIKHPILDILNGEDYSYSELIEYISLYMGSIGVCYVRKVKENNKIISLEPLLSEFVTPIVNGKQGEVEGEVTQYKYNPPNKNEVIPADDIIQFVNYSPGNKVVGIGDLEVCLDAALRSKYYDDFEKYIAKNNGRPDFIISTKNNIKEEEAKTWYKKFISKYMGVKNSGKPLMLNGEYKIDVLNFKPNELNFQNGRKEAKATICSAYGVPISMIDNSEQINRATAYAGLEQYARYTIYPKLSKIIEVLNKELVKDYDDNLFLWFDELQLTDTELVAERIMKQVQARIITIDEAREKLGYEAMEMDDTEMDDKKEEDKDEE